MTDIIYSAAALATVGGMTGNDNVQRPVKGDRATMQIGSMLCPCTVVDVSRTGHRVTLRHDGMVVDHMAGPCEVMRPEEDLRGEVVTVGRGRDGTYRHEGRYRVTFGEWRASR